MSGVEVESGQGVYIVNGVAPAALPIVPVAETKISRKKMTADSDKDAVHCLLCHNKVDVSTTNSISIFDENVLTSLQKPVIDVLCSTLEIAIDETNAHSLIICNKCYKLVNEADEVETRLTDIKSEICNLYQKTITILSEENICYEEYNDHDYIDMTDNVENNEEFIKDNVETECEEQSENVTISETSNLDQSDLLKPDDIKSETIQEGIEEYQENNANISDDNIIDDDTHVLSLENEEEIEEVVVEKKDSGRRIRKKVEPIREVLTRDGDNYVCAICSDDEKQNMDYKSIISHLKDEHDVRVYICDICGDHFRKRTELSHHLDDHVANEEGDFQCEVCNRIFSNLRFFRIHKRIHYPQLKSWGCEICNKRYSSKNLLDEHMNTHTGNRPYVCEVCGKNFASKYTHHAHVKTHGIRPRPYQCTQCIKTFLSHQNLVQHMKTHNGLKEFLCQQCGKAFGSAHNLEVHNIVHTGYKPYICSICGKAFARKAEIRDHERTHTGEKPYQCEFCGATFSQRSNLQSHKRATHYNDKRYKCDDCGKGFKRRRLLDYHIKAAHTGERPYKCDTCTATFVYPEHFKKHMRIHTGEKPYLCEVCGKAFNSRDNRNAHRFIHSDKKPYECLVCGMGFMRKPLLYSHMKAQGHLNDTIIVNQPAVFTGEDVIIQNQKVHIIMDDDTEEIPENAELIVANLKDHVIIQESDGQSVLNITEAQNLGIEEIPQFVVQSQGITYQAATELECKSESEEAQEIYGYQDEEGNTIVLPEGADIKEIIGDGSKAVQLVQIRIPSGVTEDGRTWFSLVQNSSIAKAEDI